MWERGWIYGVTILAIVWASSTGLPTIAPYTEDRVFWRNEATVSARAPLGDPSREKRPSGNGFRV